MPLDLRAVNEWPRLILLQHSFRAEVFGLPLGYGCLELPFHLPLNDLLLYRVPMVSQDLQIRRDEVRLHLLFSHCSLESLPLLGPLLLFDFLLLLLLGYLRRSVFIADSFDL